MTRVVAAIDKDPEFISKRQAKLDMKTAQRSAIKDLVDARLAQKTPILSVAHIKEEAEQ